MYSSYNHFIDLLMFMCFLTYFIVYASYSNCIYYFTFRMYFVHSNFGLFLHTLCIWSVIVLLCGFEYKYM